MKKETVKQAAPIKKFDPKKVHISTAEKLTMISNFATMLSAGISILEAVDSLLEDAKSNQRKVLETLREDLIQGKRINQSFAKFPNVFDRVTVSIIKAAEESGTLDTTLKDLRDNIRKENEFVDKIKAALTYPIVIFIVFIGVLGMILIVVIPKISTVFSRLNVTLPLPTKIMIFISNIILSYTIPFVVIIVLFCVGLIFLYQTKRKLLLGIVFSLPLVSELVKQIDLVRFTRSLNYLLSSGITIISALELSEDVVMRKDIAEVIKRSKEMIVSGKKLSEGLKTSKGKIPSIMIKIIEAGEKSGSLDKSLKDISDYLDYQVSNTLLTLTALLEPIMLVLVGVLVGGMMLAIIGPIYQMIGQVGRR
ncbi:type II secretion system F family protein [Candidatus Roizmanbacteria bacterium]|nr:type II secretion system F family protein [Candidatus Roizmanbacteria bacterium]